MFGTSAGRNSQSLPFSNTDPFIVLQVKGNSVTLVMFEREPTPFGRISNSDLSGAFLYEFDRIVQKWERFRRVLNKTCLRNVFEMIQNFKVELLNPFVSRIGKSELSTLSCLKTGNAPSASVEAFSNLDEGSEVWDLSCSIRKERNSVKSSRVTVSCSSPGIERKTEP